MMRERIVRLRSAAVFLLFAILLNSCGIQGKQETLQEMEQLSSGEAVEAVVWGVQEMRLPDADEALSELLTEGDSAPVEIVCGMTDSVVLRVVRMYGEGMEEAGICIQVLETPDSIWENTYISKEEWFPEGQYGYVSAASLCPDGSIYFFLHTGLEEDGSRQFYMAKWERQKGMGAVRKIPKTAVGSMPFQNLYTVYVDLQEHVYLAGETELRGFEQDFSEGKRWGGRGKVLQITEQTFAGELLFCGNSEENEFCIWKAWEEEPLFSTDEIVMDGVGRAVLQDERKSLLCTPMGVWQFSIAEGTLCKILSFTEFGYQIDRVCGAEMEPDGGLLVLADISGEYLLLRYAEDEERQNLPVLELAVTVPDPFLKEAIVKFNGESENCRIELRTPGQGESFDDFRTRVQAEISGGGGPDLLSNFVTDPSNAAKKGFVKDLSSEFAAEMQKMLPNVAEAGRVGDKIYAVPYSFGVLTLVTSEKFADGRERWITEELMKSAQASGAETAISGYNGSALFQILITYSMDGGSEFALLNPEQTSCFFDSEEVREMLAFSEQYGDEGSYQDSGIRAAEGEILAIAETISNLWVPQAMQAVFQGEEVYIGYPSSPEKSGNRLSCQMLSVNHACQYPEEAAAFIRFLLEEKNQVKLAERIREPWAAGFPVSEEVLDHMFAELLSTEGTFDEAAGLAASYNGYEYAEGSLSGESLEKVKRLVMSAAPVWGELDGVGEILSDETEDFFAGAKSSAEVCHNLQNRIQLFLDERK